MAEDKQSNPTQNIPTNDPVSPTTESRDSDSSDEEIDPSLMAHLRNVLNAFGIKNGRGANEFLYREHAEEDISSDEEESCSSAFTHHLDIPAAKRNWLLSPPPSPPENWRPIKEDINRIPIVDLHPERENDHTVLLPATNGMPKIIIT